MVPGVVIVSYAVECCESHIYAYVGNMEKRGQKLREKGDNVQGQVKLKKGINAKNPPSEVMSLPQVNSKTR